MPIKDDDLIAVENRRLSGRYHWLIMPKAHKIRDIEALDGNDLPLCKPLLKLAHVPLPRA